MVSVLFSEPKIPQFSTLVDIVELLAVSVLFSEPKIPQFNDNEPASARVAGFSALQRAENSSIVLLTILTRAREIGFSALQRAENSSIARGAAVGEIALMFQCSSASRKFLNADTPTAGNTTFGFQCSSASRKFLNSTLVDIVELLAGRFSALQRAENSSMRLDPADIALLRGFSALQRAENSSIGGGAVIAEANSMFQCSSASRKFLNDARTARCGSVPQVSVLFSEPKIPQ